MRWFASLLCLSLGIAGCASQGVYTKVRSDDPNCVPRLYMVDYDNGYLMALHAVELEPKWKLTYFDKNTGVIEAKTDHNDKLTVRVNPIDRAAVKIFAYCDTAGNAWFSEGRLKESLSRYFAKLDSHLKGFDEKVLQ